MPEIASNSALCGRHLRKSYKDVVAVDGLDLEVQRASASVFWGRMRGKNDYRRNLEGLTAPDSGDVEVLASGGVRNAAQLASASGFSCRIRNSPKAHRIRTVRLFRSFFRQGAETSEVIARVQLEEKQKSRVGRSLRRPETTPGPRLRACWRSDFLFLDEPTTRFGSQARRSFGN